MAAATALVAYGFRRRSVAGIGLAVAAAPLAYRGLIGEWPLSVNGRRPDTRRALSGAKGVHVREAIRLETPIDEVFGFWRRVENFPRFMSHLERVVDLGGGRSHWVAKAPAGLVVEWDAEIINEQPNKVIAWRSLPGSEVVTAGSVHFATVRAGQSSQVSVHLQYAPPVGRAGAWLAWLFGSEPSQTIREDLRHVKNWLEAGEVPRAAADTRHRSRR
jgi:uncharacterized membrane protein